MIHRSPACRRCVLCGGYQDPRFMMRMKNPRTNRMVRACSTCFYEAMRRGVGTWHISTMTNQECIDARIAELEADARAAQIEEGHE